MNMGLRYIKAMQWLGVGNMFKGADGAEETHKFLVGLSFMIDSWISCFYRLVEANVPYFAIHAYVCGIPVKHGAYKEQVGNLLPQVSSFRCTSCNDDGHLYKHCAY